MIKKVEGMDIEFERVKVKGRTSYRGFKLLDNGEPPKDWYENAPEDFEEFIIYPDYDTVAKEVGVVGNIRESEPTQDSDSSSQNRSSRTRRGENSETASDSENSGHRTRQPRSQEEVVRDPDPKPETEAKQEEATNTRRSRSANNSDEPGVDPEVADRINRIKNLGASS